MFVSWWETNPITGSSKSVLRVSTDAERTFCPALMPGTHGTISTTTTNNNTETTLLLQRRRKKQASSRTYIYIYIHCSILE